MGLGSGLAWVSIAATKYTMTSKQVGEEGIYLAYISILEHITEGSQDRKGGRAD